MSDGMSSNIPYIHDSFNRKKIMNNSKQVTFYWSDSN